MGHFPKKFVSLMFYCSRFGLRSTRDLSRFDRFEKAGPCRTAQARHDLPLSIQQSLGSYVKKKELLNYQIISSNCSRAPVWTPLKDGFEWIVKEKTLHGDCAGTYELELLVEVTPHGERRNTGFFRCNVPHCKRGDLFEQLIERNPVWNRLFFRKNI